MNPLREYRRCFLTAFALAVLGCVAAAQAGRLPDPRLTQDFLSGISLPPGAADPRLEAARKAQSRLASDKTVDAYLARVGEAAVGLGLTRAQAAAALDIYLKNCIKKTSCPDAPLPRSAAAAIAAQAAERHQADASARVGRLAAGMTAGLRTSREQGAAGLPPGAARSRGDRGRQRYASVSAALPAGLRLNAAAPPSPISGSGARPATKAPPPSTASLLWRSNGVIAGLKYDASSANLAAARRFAADLQARAQTYAKDESVGGYVTENLLKLARAEVLMTVLAHDGKEQFAVAGQLVSSLVRASDPIGPTVDFVRKAAAARAELKRHPSARNRRAYDQLIRSGVVEGLRGLGDMTFPGGPLGAKMMRGTVRGVVQDFTNSGSAISTARARPTGRNVSAAAVSLVMPIVDAAGAVTGVGGVIKAGGAEVAGQIVRASARTVAADAAATADEIAAREAADTAAKLAKAGKASLDDPGSTARPAPEPRAVPAEIPPEKAAEAPTASSLLTLGRKFRESGIDPRKTNIPEFSRLVRSHLDYARNGILKQNVDLGRMDIFKGFAEEAEARVRSGQVTYEWWHDFNYRLSILMTPAAQRTAVAGGSEQAFVRDLLSTGKWKTNQGFREIADRQPRGGKYSSSINAYDVAGAFPRRIVLPVMEGDFTIGQINAMYGSDINPVGLIDRCLVADGREMCPDHFFRHDHVHASNEGYTAARNDLSEADLRKLRGNYESYEKTIPAEDRQAFEFGYFIATHELPLTGDLVYDGGTRLAANENLAKLALDPAWYADLVPAWARRSEGDARRFLRMADREMAEFSAAYYPKK